MSEEGMPEVGMREEGVKKMGMGIQMIQQTMRANGFLMGLLLLGTSAMASQGQDLVQSAAAIEAVIKGKLSGAEWVAVEPEVTKHLNRIRGIGYLMDGVPSSGSVNSGSGNTKRPVINCNQYDRRKPNSDIPPECQVPN